MYGRSRDFTPTETLVISNRKSAHRRNIKVALYLQEICSLIIYLFDVISWPLCRALIFRNNGSLIILLPVDDWYG